jgi:hypothetical protein
VISKSLNFLATRNLMKEYESGFHGDSDSKTGNGQKYISISSAWKERRSIDTVERDARSQGPMAISHAPTTRQKPNRVYKIEFYRVRKRLFESHAQFPKGTRGRETA